MSRHLLVVALLLVAALLGCALEAVLGLLARIGQRMTWAHVQKLRVIEGETGFTKAQGQ